MNTIVACVFIFVVLLMMFIVGAYSIFTLNKKQTPDRLTLKISGGNDMNFTRIEVGQHHFAILDTMDPERWIVFSEVFKCGVVTVNDFRMTVRMPNEDGAVVFEDDTDLPSTFENEERLPMLVNAIMAIKRRLNSNNTN
jgi:hypothetical protein